MKRTPRSVRVVVCILDPLPLDDGMERLLKDAATMVGPLTGAAELVLDAALAKKLGVRFAICSSELTFEPTREGGA